MAPGVGQLELQAVAEVARQRGLQTVVDRLAVGFESSDARAIESGSWRTPARTLGSAPDDPPSVSGQIAHRCRIRHRAGKSARNSVSEVLDS